MRSNALDEEVRAFFQTYTAAFEALDVEAIADCVAYPSHIASDGEETVLMPWRTGSSAWPRWTGL